MPTPPSTTDSVDASSTTLSRADTFAIAPSDRTAKAAALEPKLTRLTIVVARPVPQIEVSRDSVVVAPSQWNTPVPIDPGQHVVGAVAPGRIPFSTPVAVSTGDVTVPVPELVLPPPPAYMVPPPYAAPTPKKPRYSTGMMAGGIVMVVAGPIAMLGAALSGADFSGGGHNDLGPGATAVVVIGGLTTIAGIPLIAVGAHRVDPDPANASRLRLDLGPGSAGISGVF